VRTWVSGMAACGFHSVWKKLSAQLYASMLWRERSSRGRPRNKTKVHLDELGESVETDLYLIGHLPWRARSELRSVSIRG
jgi:hypothetical protein